MLRIALELKKPQTELLDAIVSRVVMRMGLDGDAFRRYLDANVGLLRATSARAFLPPPTAANLTPEAAPARRRRSRLG